MLYWFVGRYELPAICVTSTSLSKLMVAQNFIPIYKVKMLNLVPFIKAFKKIMLRLIIFRKIHENITVPNYYYLFMCF